MISKKLYNLLCCLCKKCVYTKRLESTSNVVIFQDRHGNILEALYISVFPCLAEIEMNKRYVIKDLINEYEQYEIDMLADEYLDEE